MTTALHHGRETGKKKFPNEKYNAALIQRKWKRLLVISRFCFLRFGSQISMLGEIILPGMQILKSDLGYQTEVGFVSHFSLFMSLLVVFW